MRRLWWLCVLALPGCEAAAEPAPPTPVAPSPAKSEPEPEPPPPPVFVEPEPPKPRVPHLDCEPIAEQGYRKGKRFPVTVVTIDGRMVEQRTADAYWAMQLAAAEDGVELPIYSGFRTNAEQKYFYRCYKTCSCNSCTKAARPGHSNHQSGRALDIGLRPGTHEWLVTNAKQFGFQNTIRSEPWHWEYRGRRRGRWPSACPAE